MTENIKKLRQCFMTLLEVFSKVCEKQGVDWFLFAGSLLGAIRHKGFIPWDDDIDVCVRESDLNKLIIANWPKGYLFTRYNMHMYKLCIDGTTMVNCKSNIDRSTVKRNAGGIKIDIFPLFDTIDKSGLGIPRYTSLFRRGEKDLQIPKYCFDYRTLAAFEGKEFPIPKDYDTVLKCIYGPDYMTPKKVDQHVFFVDFNHGNDEYSSGKLKIPLMKDFKPTDGGVMFAKE